MATPIVIVTANGIPVTEAANGLGTPVVVANNGQGIPVIVIASGGLPVVGTGTSG
jgi:glycosyltransferase involved in cell wall biosynthesis